jgi:HPt (histidine-containing phosphotransfer) domain-containing protein
LTIWRDVQAYQKYLRKFARDYAVIAQTLAQLDKSAALALAHKFKGAASNLALQELATAATATGQALQQEQDVLGSLQQLQSAVDTALASIAQFAPPETVKESPVTGVLDTEQVAALLKRMLAVFHTDQPSQIRPVLAELDKALPPDQLLPLHVAVDNYDFREGEVAARAIALSLGLSLES